MGLGDAAWLVSTAGALAFWVWFCVRLSSLRRLPRLLEVAPEPPVAGWPRLSVIAPSRDEAAGVEAATRSLLAQDYPDLEVIAVDDRSTDATGRILDGLAEEQPRLSVLHIGHLPEGWLGKNHALAQGALRAGGEWLLFTDGDVVFAPDALRRAIAFAYRHGLGHVVALPHLVTSGVLERAFVSAVAIFLNLKFRLWGLSKARTPGYIGVGAFNLVRRDAYERVGGHLTVALEVADDAKLGLILRRSGVPQGAADSGGLVSVRWQHGWRATMGGLVKNAFAGSELRVAVALVGAAFILLVSVAPIATLIWASHPAVRLLAAVAAAIPALLMGLAARRVTGGNGIEGLLFAPSAVLLALVLFWSMLSAWVPGVVVWRGTRYSLAALRRGCVRERDWPVDGAVGWPLP